MPIATQMKENPNMYLQVTLSSSSYISSSFGKTTAEIRAKKDPSWPMKILKGEAVEYMARGTYSSIIRLVATRDTPHPKPEIVRLMQITEKYMN